MRLETGGLSPWVTGCAAGNQLFSRYLRPGTARAGDGSSSAVDSFVLPPCAQHGALQEAAQSGMRRDWETG